MEYLQMQIDINDRLAYGISQAVKATSVGRSKLYQEIKAGRLKTFKVGTRTLIATEDLSAWLSDYRSTGAEAAA
jgi:excisionase family DNA binding protein